MAISQNLLLTLPPPTRSDFRGRTGGEYPLLLTDFQATRFRFGSVSPAPPTMERKPKWRNWQTRRTQNPVPLGECGFDSHLRHRTVEPIGPVARSAPPGGRAT